MRPNKRRPTPKANPKPVARLRVIRAVMRLDSERLPRRLARLVRGRVRAA